MGSRGFSILAAALAFLLPQLAPCAEPAKVSDAAIEGAVREYEKLAERYGIEIVLTKPVFPKDGHVGGRSADPKKVSTYLALFKSEWSFYPTELMAQSGIKRVIFCEDLVSSHFGPVGGLADGHNWQDLYIDIGDGRWSKLYTRRVVHHEYFHMVDHQMHAKVGVRHGLPDTIWEGLNPPEFKYGQITLKPSTALDLKLKGFLSTYSQSAVQEDKAELYSCMITMGQIVDDRAKIDPVLAAKADRIRSLVKAFCPQMNEEFWKAARKVSRTGG